MVDNKIDLIDISITQDSQSYLWTGTVKLARYSDYARVRVGDPIVLSIQDTHFNMIVESRSHADDGSTGTVSMSFKVASPTLKLNDKKKKITKTWGAATARQICEELAGSTIDWNIMNWSIPSGRLTVSNNTPMEIIRKVVEAAGGIVQTKPDGTLRVQYFTPIAINKLWSIAPTHTLNDRQHILSSTEESTNTDIYDTVILADAESDVENDRQYNAEYIEVDDHHGTIRIYAEPWIEPSGFTLTTTGHPSIQIGSGVITYLEETESTEFKAGLGTVKYPIFQLKGYQWKYADIGSIFWTLDSKAVKTSSGYSIAKITYVRRVIDIPISHALLSVELTQFLVWEYSNA